jgi:1,4-alpha-glucan branching enzyme
MIDERHQSAAPAVADVIRDRHRHHPGKKLLFMGGEWAQEREWNHDRDLDWRSIDDLHAGIQRLVRDLNRIYASEPSLHRRDCEASGFQWVIGDDRSNSVFAFLRLAANEAPVLVVCNMTPVPRHGYRIGVPRAGNWREICVLRRIEYRQQRHRRCRSGPGTWRGAIARTCLAAARYEFLTPRLIVKPR